MIRSDKGKTRFRVQGVFGTKIKGFEEEYFFLKNLYNEKGWSRSAIQSVMMRFVEGWRYDGLDKVHHTPESLDLERKVILLRGLGHNRQSKIYFTTQYGEHLGEIKFKEVQTFQALSNSKEYKGMTDEEFKRYNNSRAITLKNMIKKYGKEEGLRRYSDFLVSRRCSFSKMASSLFRKTESSLNRDDITYIYQPKTEEFSIYQKNRSFFYDFCIPELKFIIEFNGDIFHGNPQLFNESDCPNPFDRTLTAKQMWLNDKEKIDLAKSKGFEVMIIWERDYRNDPETIMNNIIKTISEKLKNS